MALKTIKSTKAHNEPWGLGITCSRDHSMSLYGIINDKYQVVKLYKNDKRKCNGTQRWKSEPRVKQYIFLNVFPYPCDMKYKEFLDKEWSYRYSAWLWSEVADNNEPCEQCHANKNIPADLVRYQLLIWWMTNSVYRKLESEIMWWTMVNEHWFFQSTMVLTMIYLMRVTDKDNWMDEEQMNLKKNSPDQKNGNVTWKTRKKTRKRKFFFFTFF